MDFMGLQSAVATAFVLYRQQTNLDPNPEYLKIHIHPDDLAEVRKTAEKIYFNLDGYIADKGLLGIPLVMDPEVETGHPEVRSSWKWVL